MKRTLILIACLIFAVGTLQAHEIEKYKDKKIEELSQKAFRYSENKGKPTLKLITGYSGDITSQGWYLEGYGKPCDNNVAKLNRPGVALPIPGTSLILTFLDCPACNDAGEDSIIAVFDRNNTSVPLCFRHIKLMDKKGFYFWGSVRSIGIRKSREKGYYVVAKLSGGDAGDLWTSLAFLHIDDNCKVTILSKLYECVTEEEDGNKCSDKEIDYRFLDDHVVDVITTESRIDSTKKDVNKSHKEYDLKLLYDNPKARTFKP
jgi:hypothetical protein